MSDYNASIVSGQAWQRTHRIVFENPVGAVPTAVFFEQQAIAVGDEIITRERGVLSATFDSAATFDVLDEDLQPTGKTMTQADLLVAMRSLYLHLAQQRDADIAARQSADAQQQGPANA